MTFGPTYPKIDTVFKRDAERRLVIIPGDYSTPEFEYLADAQWVWTEKVDGTNIRLHWNGSEVTIGGRTDEAQVPAPLVANLRPFLEPDTWTGVFPDAADVTLYGEGYGAKIQKGGQYRPDQAFVLFDVKIGPWWLQRPNAEDIAGKVGFDAVPIVGTWTLPDACEMVRLSKVESAWPGARIEGLVGRPAVDLFNRKGERIVTKIKVKDYTDLARLGP